jgi:clusterin-associated protein 1
MLGERRNELLCCCAAVFCYTRNGLNWWRVSVFASHLSYLLLIMSYREFRDFRDSLLGLGYPRLISSENFKQPNFELVADIVYWLLIRYDPSISNQLAEDISNEQARITFLTTAAEIIQAKARVKLNIKQLYRADGYAVKELLKLSNLLYIPLLKHQKLLKSGNSNAAIDPSSQLSLDQSLSSQLTQKLEELKEAKSLSSEIIESGGKLYSLLAQEIQLKTNRDKALNFIETLNSSLDSSASSNLIEKTIRSELHTVSDSIKELDQLANQLEQEQKSLKAKIERKQTEFERIEKRFKSLKSVKPAFQIEYHNLENELRLLYESYNEKFRNLQYLESELNQSNQHELEKKQETDEALRKMQAKLKQEELKILRGEAEINSSSINDNDNDQVFDSGRESGSEDAEDAEQHSESEEHNTAANRVNNSTNLNNRPQAASGHRSAVEKNSAVAAEPESDAASSSEGSELDEEELEESEADSNNPAADDEYF